LAKKKTFDRQAFVPFLMEVITNRIGANANRLYQAKFGVGLAEWRVISALALEPGSTVVELSSKSNIDAGAVSRVVFSLRKSGLISHKIDSADRRRRKLVLTAVGRALHDDMLTVALRGEDRLLQCLSLEERRNLIVALQKLFDRIMNPVRRDAPTAEETGGTKRRVR
jgi:DNA-binding MarR family transcriptional regulator